MTNQPEPSSDQSLCSGLITATTGGPRNTDRPGFEEMLSDPRQFVGIDPAQPGGDVTVSAVVELPDPNRPLIFRIPEACGRPFPRANRFGVYFPGTDLCVSDMGQRGTGKPEGVEWVAEAAAPLRLTAADRIRGWNSDLRDEIARLSALLEPFAAYADLVDPLADDHNPIGDACPAADSLDEWANARPLPTLGDCRRAQQAVGAMPTTRLKDRELPPEETTRLLQASRERRFLQTCRRWWSDGDLGPDLVSVISSQCGWNPLTVGENMTVHFGDKEYEIIRKE